MRITLKQLRKLSVETQSGQDLGAIKDIVFDIDSQMVAQYEVGAMLGDHILFSREQVLSISAEKMIVEDSVVREGNQSIDSASVVDAV